MEEFLSENQSVTHEDREASRHPDGETRELSAYCKDLLMGGEELSLEELRAKSYNQRKQKEMEEKLRRLKEEEEQLFQELEEKKMLLLRKSQQSRYHSRTSPTSDSSSEVQVSDLPPAAASFQIYDDSRSAAANPAGRSCEATSHELPDDVFMQPDERGLSVKIQLPPRPEAVVQVQTGPQNSNLDCTAPNRSCNGQPGGTSKDLQTQLEPHPKTLCQTSVSKSRDQLSPIEETSVEAGSLSSLGGVSGGNHSPVDQDQNQDQDQEEMDQSTSPCDSCDPDLRRRLLKLCDVTSCPDLHSEPRPLPAIDERSFLHLGGDMFYIHSRVVDGDSFSIFKGSTDNDSKDVLIKVDRCTVFWDFHQFLRLKKSSPAPDGLPLISCFLFEDGCVTVYTTPPDNMFTELNQSDSSDMAVSLKAIGLLQLVSQLHSCRLVHGALHPSILRGILDGVFPLDWSLSVDLDLQQDITSVQQLPSAETYITLGLLAPTAPPHMVDLVGVAETVHLLLTNRKMVPVKDGDRWTVEQFRDDESWIWKGFFQLLLNAGDRSSLCVLSELEEQLSSLYL